MVRKVLVREDLKVIRDILESSGFFYDFEVAVALETAVDNLEKGEDKSGYCFRLLEEDGVVRAFASFGHSPCTIASYDLYWIAVHQEYMGKGYGGELMQAVEDELARAGGGNLWIETSGRPLYEPTRRFYLLKGCDQVAELPHFYAQNDPKIIFLKVIQPAD